MKFDKFTVWGHVQAHKGFDEEKMQLYQGDNIELRSGTHVGTITLIGITASAEIHNGGKVDTFALCAKNGTVTVFSGGVLDYLDAIRGKVVVSRGGIISSASVCAGADVTVYSGGIISEITKTSRSKLDIRKGAIVTTIKTEDLNDEDEA